MSDFGKYLNKQLDNKEFKKEWDNSKNEYDLAKSQVADVYKRQRKGCL